MNVLLFAMSTAAGTRDFEYRIPDKYRACAGAGDDKISGKTQMEPVPKMLMKYFDAKNCRLDAVYVLASYETLSKMEGMDIDVHDFVKGELESFASENGIAGENIPAYCRIDLFRKDQNGNPILNEKGESIPDQNTAMKECVKAIRRSKCEAEEKGEEFHLYIDIHGGPREEQLTTDAIMQLMKNEGITVREAFSIPFGRDRAVEIVTGHLRAYDLVSAVDSFVNYGKARGIRALFDGSSGKIKDILETISRISDSLLFCNPALFKEGLRDLGKQVADEDLRQVEEEEPLFWILIEYIKNDYDRFDLLTGEPGDLNMIRWCLSKEFYQQALTIIENQTPDYIIGQKIIYFDRENACIKDYLKSKNKIWVEDAKSLFDDYAVQEWDMNGVQSSVWKKTARQIVYRQYPKDVLSRLTQEDMQKLADDVLKGDNFLPQNDEENSKKAFKELIDKKKEPGNDHIPEFLFLWELYATGDWKKVLEKYGTGIGEKFYKALIKTKEKKLIGGNSLVKNELKNYLEVENEINARTCDGIKAVFHYLHPEKEGGSELDSICGEFCREDRFLIPDADKDRQRRWERIAKYLAKKLSDDLRVWKGSSGGGVKGKLRSRILQQYLAPDWEMAKYLGTYYDPRTVAILYGREPAGKNGEEYDEKITVQKGAVRSNVRDEFMPVLDILLLTHTFLKIERNESNHGSGAADRTPKEELVKLMGDYVELLEYLSKEGMNGNK